VPKPRRRVRADARLNRERLLSAAREVLAERGFEAEVSEIASRAGVGAGTIYRNFQSREELLLGVAREMSYKTSSQLLAIAADVADARECVARAMEVGFQRVEEYGQLAIQLVGGTAPEPFAGVISRDTLGQYFRLLLQRGVGQGHFRADLDVEYAVAVWFALVAPQALSSLMQRRSVAEIAKLTTDFFLAGISAPPPEAKRPPEPEADPARRRSR
jgi:AcrR family transcriptional regulator